MPSSQLSSHLDAKAPVQFAVQSALNCCSQLVLLTFPGVKRPHVTEPKGEAYSQAVSTLLPYLLSHRSRLAAFSAATASPSPATAGKDKASDTHLDGPAHQKSDFLEASEAAAARDAFDVEDDAEEPDSPMRNQPQEFLAGLQPEQRHRLAVLVDTAILKVTNAQLLPLEDKLTHL